MRSKGLYFQQAPSLTINRYRDNLDFFFLVGRRMNIDSNYDELCDI